MALVEKLTEEELAVLEILRHPAWCGEFIRELDMEEDDDWEYTDYQMEFLCDANPRVSICSARAVGKSVSLIDRLIWYSLNNFWDETIVYTVPNRVHLEPIFTRLSKWFRQHPLLGHYTGRTGINSQSYTIKLSNNSVIDCRIAGQSGTGANVVGLHVPVILLDEAGFYPWGTYLELIPCLNDWQEGSQLIISGVPTGQREKNVLFYADRKDAKFTKHRISAFDNPRYSEEDNARNLKQFGGEESEDYQHFVLAEHGVPSYSMFDRGRMLIGNYDVFKGSLYGQKIKKNPAYLIKYYNSLPALPAHTTQVMFGIDLGYVEPTIILVWYKTHSINHWRYLVRTTLKQVDYDKQEKIIDKFDSLYKPDFLGIDEGHSGKALIQHLRNDPQYRHKKFSERIIPIKFRSTIPVGKDEDGDDISVRAKQFGMQLLQSKVNNHNYEFTWKDEAFISELERTTYRRTPSGELVFKTLTVHGGSRHGQDHNLAAFLCGELANYLVYDVGKLQRQREKLYRPRWGVF